MSDFNDGVDDYRGKNQMNGASGNAGYSQNGQAYGQQYGQSYSQQYGQSAQHHDQMQQQPQFASPYGQPVQQQMNQQQMGQSYGRHAQPQMSQQQFGQKPYGQPVQSRMSQQSPYGQPPIGRPYGSPAFADRAGYVNGRFNSSYIEEQARKFYSIWNAKEIISSIIVCILAGILAFVLSRYEFSVLYKTMWFIAKKLFRYSDKHYNLLGIAFNAAYLLPLTLILGFAQVIRKRFFTVASGAFIFAIIFLIRIFFAGKAIGMLLIGNYLLVSLPILIFVVFVEALQQAITKYRPKNDLSYMLINFASAIIFCIAEIIAEIIYNSISNLWPTDILTTAVEFLIPAVLLLVILPCLVSLLLKAVKFTKFLNPEREMMHL